jgi:hypothetical protein
MEVPAEVDIEARALLRDVDVLVPEGTHVELFGGVLRGDLENAVPPHPEDERGRVDRIDGHCLLGDVTARVAPRSARAGRELTLGRGRRASTPCR